MAKSLLSMQISFSQDWAQLLDLLANSKQSVAH